MAVQKKAPKSHKEDDDGVLPDEFEVNSGSDSENESEDGEFFEEQGADEEDSEQAASDDDDITAGFKVVDDEDEAMTDDEEGEEEEDEENERFAVEESHSEVEPSGSEDGSDGEKGDASKSSAYSRAFSKIFQNKAAKESETVREIDTSFF